MERIKQVRRWLGVGEAWVTWTNRNLVGQRNLAKIRKTKERTTKELNTKLS